MLLFGATLLIAMSFFHSILGERFILSKIKANNSLPKMWESRETTFRTIQATWHLVSALWFALALQLIAMTLKPDSTFESLLWVFGVLFAVLSIVPFIFRAGKHKSWIAFGLIAIMLIGKAILG